jgi:lipid-A-disaccharide synthase-like uncharacterized protein
MGFFEEGFGPWQIFGFAGALCFGSRFFLQWIASERAKRSVMPLSFWYLSLAGSFILLIYFFRQRDIVGVSLYLANSIPYTRNLILIGREKRAAKGG